MIKIKSLTAVIMQLGDDHMTVKQGRSNDLYLIKAQLFLESTTQTVESWDTQASLVPSGEKDTSWTQPPKSIKKN